MSSSKFKFPRLEAGLYRVVMDKVDVGLIQKQVDGKEVAWWIHETVDPLDIGPSNSVGNPDDLLREAKDCAIKYFTNKTSEVATKVTQPVVEEKGILDEEPQVEEDFFDSLSAFEDFEDDFLGDVDSMSLDEELLNV